MSFRCNSFLVDKTPVHDPVKHDDPINDKDVSHDNNNVAIDVNPDSDDGKEFRMRYVVK